MNLSPNQLMQFAVTMLERNPNIANNPQAQAMLDVLRTGDAQRGQQIANNLCQSMGVTPQQAVQEAASYFKL